MDFSEGLLRHASELVGDSQSSNVPQDIRLRRAISASYYALFHQINEDASSLLAPKVSTETKHRIQRWFNHGEMKIICGRFMAPVLSQPLLDLIGPAVSPDLQTVARNFVTLQEARHSADYDLSYPVDFAETLGLVVLSIEAKEAWQRVQGSAEANIFMLSLLMWKNWEKERP
jgi:hypothetical protein